MPRPQQGRRMRRPYQPSKSVVDARNKAGHDGGVGDKPGHDEDWLDTYLAETDACPEPGLDGLLAPALDRYLDDIGTRVLIELVEFEVAVIVALGFRNRAAVL